MPLLISSSKQAGKEPQLMTDVGRHIQGPKISWHSEKLQQEESTRAADPEWSQQRKNLGSCRPYQPLLISFIRAFSASFVFKGEKTHCVHWMPCKNSVSRTKINMYRSSVQMQGQPENNTRGWSQQHILLVLLTGVLFVERIERDTKQFLF